MEIKELFETVTSVKIRSMERLPNGVNNRVYLINSSYVVRDEQTVIDIYNNSEIELKVIEAIVPLKISETVLYYDQKNGIKISKLLRKTFHYREYLNHEQLFQVAKTLKKLHSLKVNDIPEFKLFERIDFYKSKCPTHTFFNKEEEKKLTKEVLSWYKGNSFVLCHNDLIKFNLLFSFTKCYLIDWEYGMLNHPYADLASIIGENNIVNEEDITFFLKSYFGSKYSLLKHKRVIQLMRLRFFEWYYWSIFMYEEKKEAIFLEIAAFFLDSIKNR